MTGSLWMPFCEGIFVICCYLHQQGRCLLGECVAECDEPIGIGSQVAHQQLHYYADGSNQRHCLSEASSQALSEWCRVRGIIAVTLPRVE